MNGVVLAVSGPTRSDAGGEGGGDGRGVVARGVVARHRQEDPAPRREDCPRKSHAARRQGPGIRRWCKYSIPFIFRAYYTVIF